MLLASPALAGGSEREAREFIAQVEALMNRRKMDEIRDFYKFYSVKDARFIADSKLVDPNNQDKVIAEESKNMNVDEYLLYLKGILETPNRYSYSATIDSIKLDRANDTASVMVTTRDSSVTTKRDEERQRDYLVYVLETSNCNYSLVYKSAHYYIAGMNCAAKINKTTVY